MAPKKQTAQSEQGTGLASQPVAVLYQRLRDIETELTNGLQCIPSGSGVAEVFNHLAGAQELADCFQGVRESIQAARELCSPSARVAEQSLPLRTLVELVLALNDALNHLAHEALVEARAEASGTPLKRDSAAADAAADALGSVCGVTDRHTATRAALSLYLLQSTEASHG